MKKTPFFTILAYVPDEDNQEDASRGEVSSEIYPDTGRSKREFTPAENIEFRHMRKYIENKTSKLKKAEVGREIHQRHEGNEGADGQHRLVKNDCQDNQDKNRKKYFTGMDVQGHCHHYFRTMWHSLQIPLPTMCCQNLKETP